MKTISRDIKLLKKVQEELRSLVICTNKITEYQFVGGCDVSYRGEIGVGAFVVFNRNFQMVDVSVVRRRIEFPYVPGYLAFREVPFLLEAYTKLKVKPDVVMVDGQGIAHPRGFGVASHLGVLLNLPTIGVAKSRLYGNCELPVLQRGNYTYLRDEENHIIGACLVTKDRTKPLFVSIGHLVDLEMSVKVVLDNTLSYKIPEPLRMAHSFSKVSKEDVI